MKPYEIIEHTADVGLKANGATLNGLFENAARGMFKIISGAKVDKNESGQINKKIKIKKEADDIEGLLVNWLSELLYIFNKEKILFSDFKISELNNKGLIGNSSGKRIDLAHTPLQTEIKAVTFHDLKIKKDKNCFSCKIIFDV